MDEETIPISITKINIVNFKCFKEKFTVAFNKDINIFVGNNDAGKSTILEATHLALTGVFQGKYLRNDLSQYIFNYNAVQEYLKSIIDKKPIDLPYVLIEVFIEGDGTEELVGNGNSDKEHSAGIVLKVCFDEENQPEYEELLKQDEISTLPVEYYTVKWESFARKSITPRTIPLKSALVDSSANRNINGSDMYISRIVKESLETKDIVNVSQAHRKMNDSFMSDPSIIQINTKLDKSANLSDKNIKLAVDLSVKNSWESTLITYVDDIPYHFIGKGEQATIKTKLALSHKKSLEANLLILEEPENHLSHTTLSSLLHDIESQNKTKQVLISTHNSFVANKLGLENLILVNKESTTRIEELEDDTPEFFEKIAGYDTLRLVLSKKAILVEGDSDELVVQKAYMKTHDGRLPIQDKVEIISVGTAFLRFIDIADRLKIPVTVVTDNDGDPGAIRKKYDKYLDDSGKPIGNILICFDEKIDSGLLKIDGKPFNYNTLEPKILAANDLATMNTVLKKDFKTEDELLKHMRTNKTEVALKIFKTVDTFKFPMYILKAVHD
jgi:putative ATP-dependent endonuclease of the OLD family